MKKILIMIALTLLSVSASANELYRAPGAGDKGAYYIIESKIQENGMIRVLCSRIGKGRAYTDFTEVMINCNSEQYLTLAGSYENGAKDKPSKPLKTYSKKSKWASLIRDSSKYELVKYVCKKFK